MTTGILNDISKDVYVDIRKDTYAFMAFVLNNPPDQALLSRLRNAEWHPDMPHALLLAWKGVCAAAGDYSAAVIKSEYEKLFMGLGQGEVIPYASWYIEGLLMDLPLARLRMDLCRLGITRCKDIHEAEDHAGLLLEAMALISQSENVDGEEYARFFYRHLDTWLPRFFKDLENSESAAFYRSIAWLGQCLMVLENAYLIENKEIVAH